MTANNLDLKVQIDRWDMHEPFVTACDSVDFIESVTVTLANQGVCGHGEALGVDYRGETAESMRATIESYRQDIEGGIDHKALMSLMTAGGARNAVDCALWDLCAKQQGKRAWELLGLAVAPVTTMVTVSLDSAQGMADHATSLRRYPIVKLKLDGDDTAQKIAAVRTARPDATLIIDANGSWSIDLLEELAEALIEHRIAMVEQPLPCGADDALAALQYPVPLCADESCQTLSDLPAVAPCYDMINIKLDKCGGLSKALQMVDWCKAHHMKTMVGNMLGSSLAMAPAFMVAQSCLYTDLDGPLLQTTDRAHPIVFNNARMSVPPVALWG